MAGVDEFQVALLIENAEKHRGVALHFRMITEEAIYMIEHAGGIGAERHTRKRALKHGGEQRGAKAFAGDVRDEKRGSPLAERKDVEVISTNRQAGKIKSGDGEMRVFSEIAREKRLLDVAGDVDLLLEALAFALAFDEAGVVEDAGGVGGQGVENLTVERGEGGGAARIEVENAEEIAALDIEHGFLGVGA